MNRTAAFLLAAFAILCLPLAGQQRNGPVEVRILELQPTPSGVNITLRAVSSKESIHMMIGFTEGESIMRAMRRQRAQRPMTHDLLKAFLDRNGWTVQKVLIRALARGTFLADLTLEKGSETQVFDARPSDAMAIGIRYGAKIFVNEEVFERQKENEEQQKEIKPSEPETLRL